MPCGHFLHALEKLKSFVVQSRQGFMRKVWVDHHGLRGNDLVERRKLARWRTDGIHEADAPQHFCLDAGSERLDVDIPQRLKNLVFATMSGIRMAEILLQFQVR